METKSSKKVFSFDKGKKILIVTEFLLFGLVFYTMICGFRHFMEISKIRGTYAGYFEAVDEFSDVIENMSDQVKKYVLSLDDAYISEYFAQVESKQKENSILILQETSSETARLSEAVEASNKLMDMELHAMALGMSIQGKTVSDDYPYLKNYVLPGNELELAPAKQKELVYNLVNGEEYNTLETQMEYAMHQFTDGLDVVQVEQIDYQRGRIFIVITAMFVTFILLIVTSIISIKQVGKQIINPVLKMSESISEGLDVDDSNGIEEVRTLAEAFNAQKKEVALSREKELAYIKALFSDAMVVFEVNASNGAVTQILAEDDRMVFSKCISNIGLMIPCKYDELVQSTVKFVVDEEKKRYISCSTEEFIGQYAAGNRNANFEYNFVINGEPFFLRIMVLLRKESATDDIMAMVFVKDISKN